VFSALITATSPLQTLSLRGCAVSDAAVGALCSGLRSNKTLLALNLNSNGLTSRCTPALVEALLTQRTLVSLSLADNSIDDAGARVLLSAFVPAEVTNKEHAKVLKRDGAALIAGKAGRVFRDANATLRHLSLAGNRCSSLSTAVCVLEAAGALAAAEQLVARCAVNSTFAEEIAAHAAAAHPAAAPLTAPPSPAVGTAMSSATVSKYAADPLGWLVALPSPAPPVIPASAPAAAWLPAACSGAATTTSATASSSAGAAACGTAAVSSLTGLGVPGSLLIENSLIPPALQSAPAAHATASPVAAATIAALSRPAHSPAAVAYVLSGLATNLIPFPPPSLPSPCAAIDAIGLPPALWHAPSLAPAQAPATAPAGAAGLGIGARAGRRGSLSYSDAASAAAALSEAGGPMSPLGLANSGAAAMSASAAAAAAAAAAADGALALGLGERTRLERITVAGIDFAPCVKEYLRTEAAKWVGGL
jgi:hypothetical protein